MRTSASHSHCKGIRPAPGVSSKDPLDAGVFPYLPAEGAASRRPDYAGWARAYADAMLARGRDRYGPVHAPVFSTMLDRQTMQLLDRPKETVPFERDGPGIRLHGVRSIDRSWNAANPYNDAALFELLYAMTEHTGAPRYAAAADSALQWLLNHTQHPETGLMPWGEHTAWRLDEERPTRHRGRAWGDLKHETHPLWPLWDDLFRIDRAAALRYAEALWAYHVYDKEAGLHAHQTRYDTYAPDRGYVFPRMGGNLVYVWALAYAAADDGETKQRMLSYLHRVARAEHSRRDSSGAIYRMHPKRGNGVKLGTTLQGITEAHHALDLPLPDSTKALIRAWGAASDETLLARLTAPENGGMAHLYSAELARATSGMTLWCYSYGEADVLSKRANEVARRYRQTGREGYLRFARWAADQYVGAEPACAAYPLWPKPLASAIDLLLNVHELTGEPRYLREADRLGRRAAALFLDETSPLPKVFAEGFDHYEALTGGPDLMLALYHLGYALGPVDH